MIVRFVEATQDAENGLNHGKFMVARFNQEEWDRRCEIDAKLGSERSLIGRCGWTPKHVLVLDLQTGEGAIFMPGGMASADLDKHRVWVCPMFEPFLEWLYRQDLTYLVLPPLIELPAAPPAVSGFRRPGLGKLSADLGCPVPDKCRPSACRSIGRCVIAAQRSVADEIRPLARGALEPLDVMRALEQASEEGDAWMRRSIADFESNAWYGTGASAYDVTEVLICGRTSQQRVADYFAALGIEHMTDARIRDRAWEDYIFIGGRADASYSEYERPEWFSESSLSRVIHALRKLKAEGLVTHDKEHARWMLTEEGDALLAEQEPVTVA